MHKSFPDSPSLEILFLLFLLLPVWNSDMAASASAAILDHEKTLKMEASYKRQSRNTGISWVLDDSGIPL